jgi:hypothetical protein
MTNLLNFSKITKLYFASTFSVGFYIGFTGSLYSDEFKLNPNKFSTSPLCHGLQCAVVMPVFLPTCFYFRMNKQFLEYFFYF